VLRDAYVDAVKSILILLVVFGHLIEPYSFRPDIESIYKFIYSFHMPLFAFVSGLLTKQYESRRDLYHSVLPIVVLLVVFDLIYELVNFLVTGSTSWYLRVFSPYWLLWYFLSLATWRLVSPVFFRLSFPITVSVLVSVTFLLVPQIGYPLSIARTLSFLPFFVGGLVYGRKIISWIKHHNTGKWLIIAVFVLIGIFLIVPRFDVRMLWGSFSYAQMGYHGPSGIMQKLSVLLISSIGVFSILMFARYSSLLITFGVASLSIYVWHGFFIQIISKAAVNFLQDSPLLLLIIIELALSAFICWVLSLGLATRVTRSIQKGVR